MRQDQQEFQEEEEPQPQPQPQPRQQQKQIGVRLNQQLVENIKSNPPKENDKLIIEGFDFSQAFYELQLTLLNLECPITLESHVQHALALSSILLVKPDRMHEDLMNAFDGQFNNLVSYLKGLFEISGSLPWQLITDVGKIIEEVNNHQITRDKGVIKLLSMEDDLPKEQFRVIKATANLLGKVLYKVLSEEIKEQELSTRFVEPLLTGLFDDPDNNVLLRFTGLITAEAKKNLNLTKKRPDITATLIDGLNFGTSLGFGEIKCQTESDNNYASCKDLLRIAIFSKASIDTNNLKGVLSYQVIGELLVFYILTLANDGLYILYELTDIKIPLTMDDLLKFGLDFNKLVSVLKIYGKWCVEKEPPITNSRKRLSMDDDDFDKLIEKTVDRKRECITKHWQR
ncbi:hypothetical protein K501DRAFT_263983 [Backusella circina FSU 941]|nr:hypothetical protein K501DRAFT_263983 [Backusella circina FSU 941]